MVTASLSEWDSYYLEGASDAPTLEEPNSQPDCWTIYTEIQFPLLKSRVEKVVEQKLQKKNLGGRKLFDSF